MAEGESGRRGSPLAWILVVALLATVFWLASERNARRWALGADAGHLVVLRGRSFPTGLRRSDQFPPIAIPPDAKAPAEVEFEDRVALDRAVFEQILAWARAAAEKPEAAAQARAMQLAGRAAQLHGLTPAQIEQLQTLRAGLAWTSALQDIEKAGELLTTAEKSLRLAQHAGTNAQRAAQLIQRVHEISQRLQAEHVADLPPPPRLLPPATPDGGAGGAGPAAAAPDAGAADAGRQ